MGTCSECEREIKKRGFGAHNSAMHDGQADLIEDGDDDHAGASDAPDGGADGDGDGVDLSEPDDPDGDTDGDTVTPDDPDDDDGEMSLDDDPEETTYDCGNCGEGVPYLGGDDRDGGGKECPGCGERLLWSRVEA